jgi:hypothetical protein
MPRDQHSANKQVVVQNRVRTVGPVGTDVSWQTAPNQPEWASVVQMSIQAAMKLGREATVPMYRVKLRNNPNLPLSFRDTRFLFVQRNNAQLTPISGEFVGANDDWRVYTCEDLTGREQV